VYSKFSDPYENTKEIEGIQSKIKQNDEQIIKCERKIEKIFKKTKVKYWSELSEFRNYKTNYDRETHNIVENIENHFASSFTLFANYCTEEYRKQITNLNLNITANLEYKLNYDLFKI
jgi:hypothetical protein